MPTHHSDPNRQPRSGNRGKPTLPTGSSHVNRQSGYHATPKKKGCAGGFFAVMGIVALGLWTVSTTLLALFV